MKPVSNKSILFLTSWYPTPENPTHGIFIRNHAKALSLYAPVVVVYAYSTFKPGEFKVSTNEALTEIILPYQKTKLKIPILKQAMQFIAYVRAYKTLLKYLILNRLNVSAIQVNVIYPISMVVQLFVNQFKVKYTIVEHWSGYLKADGNYKGSLQKYFTRKCVKYSSNIWHVSEKQKQSMLQHNLRGNYELLYNSVDTSIFYPTHTLKNKVIEFLHVSSLVEREKNLLGTLCALKKLSEKGIQYTFTIVGGNTEAIESVKQIQAQLGLTNITYLGHQNQSEIATHMNRCHALLLFSNYEGMPVVVLEALACGLPIFSSSVGELPNIVTSDFGRVCKSENDLTNNLELFIENKLQFDVTKMISFTNEKTSFKAVGEKLYSYYSQI